jgi:hypothetical protein
MKRTESQAVCTSCRLTHRRLTVAGLALSGVCISLAVIGCAWPYEQLGATPTVAAGQASADAQAVAEVAALVAAASGHPWITLVASIVSIVAGYLSGTYRQKFLNGQDRLKEQKK